MWTVQRQKRGTHSSTNQPTITTIPTTTTSKQFTASVLHSINLNAAKPPAVAHTTDKQHPQTQSRTIRYSPLFSTFIALLAIFAAATAGIVVVDSFNFTTYNIHSLFCCVFNLCILLLLTLFCIGDVNSIARSFRFGFKSDQWSRKRRTYLFTYYFQVWSKLLLVILN